MKSNATFSEQYSEAGAAWADLAGAADMLEQSKSAWLSQKMVALAGDVAISRAEMTVKAGDEYKDYVEKMVKARTAANHAKVRLEYLRMKFWELRSDEATERAASR